MNMPRWITNLFYSGPYLNNPNRLQDVLAAIQVLGTYEFAARNLDKWENRLGRKPKSAESWSEVFSQHSEFFTLDDSNNIALVWRRSFKRNYDTANNIVVKGDDLDKIRADEKKPCNESRLSREPLNQQQVEHLCNLAINLHEREIQHRQEKRWWITAIIAIVVAFLSLFN